MKAKRGKRKAAPAIVPRFLKSALTVGTIPVLASCGPSHKRLQPVVAYIGPDEQREPTPTPVAGAFSDAGVDAATVQQPPPPPVVAALVPPPPPVVAAMVPHEKPPAPTPPKRNKQ